MKYTELKPGEKILPGDEYWNSDCKAWIKTMMADCFVTENGAKYRRPIKKKKGSK